MNPTLRDKRALVTGGSRGIAAIVKRLAREGAHVALTYVSKPDEATRLRRRRGARRARRGHSSRQRRSKAVAAAVERTASELGGIDILVNNAGIATMAPIERSRSRISIDLCNQRPRRVRRDPGRDSAHS
jgi:3-oxoacyl-[acyl-carrier protein] reductase